MATASDADLVRDLAVRTFLATFGGMNSEENMRLYVSSAFDPATILRELEDPDSTTLILDIDGSPAGYARLLSGAAPAEVGAAAPIELVRLYIDAAHHGSGAGAALMEAALAAAKMQGRDVMWLGVWEHNPRAQAFYRKWGFERVGEHDFMLGDERQTDWLMARPV